MDTNLIHGNNQSKCDFSVERASTYRTHSDSWFHSRRRRIHPSTQVVFGIYKTQDLRSSGLKKKKSLVLTRTAVDNSTFEQKLVLISVFEIRIMYNFTKFFFLYTQNTNQTSDFGSRCFLCRV